ncbi:VanZ family protein [candidate division CSSED10-310 bacterium]|uniref:VanZ family protein n=1 Tax=candidate division CSSED10-310 bacterium TaxID=2855610 RepID=A0ABV6Z324_UNCC1
MTSKKKLITFALITYIIFLLISVPYIRIFQDFVKVNKLNIIYDVVLFLLVAVLVCLILYNLVYRKRINWQNICAYGLTVLIFLIGLSALGDFPVERVHFIQYGILVFLLFFSLKERYDDYSVYVWTFLISFFIGIADEWIQWWVPNRFGEFRDIRINFFASLFGTLCILFLIRPDGIRKTFPRQRWRGLCWALLVVVFELFGFLQCAHIGYLIEDQEIGTFRSRYSKEELMTFATTLTYPKNQQLQRLRLVTTPSESVKPTFLLDTWRKNDFYKTEAEFHSADRGKLFAGGNLLKAYRENQILEKYYSPLLVESELRWRPEKVRELEARLQKTIIQDKKYESSSNLHLWTTVSAQFLWGIYILFAALLMVFSRQTIPVEQNC